MDSPFYVTDSGSRQTITSSESMAWDNEREGLVNSVP